MSEYFNLNDLELSEQISAIHREQAKLDSLTANRKVSSLTQTLAKIEDAARKANWRLQEISPK